MGIRERLRNMAGRHGGKTGETSGDRHRRRAGTRDARIQEARERMTRERDEKGDTAGPAA